jgi:hypothetical protein
MRPTSTFKIFLCSFLLLAAGVTLNAADNGIGVTLVSYTLDTVNQVDLGYNLTIYAEVTNYDSLPFNGLINFGLHNNEDTLSNSNIFSKPPYSGDIVSLGGGTTVPAIFVVNISTPYFRPGPDVVVVWPICNQPAADSIIIHLEILDPNGINEQNEIPLTYAVVNNTILLKTTDLKINFKQVRIYNDIGQRLSEIESDFITSVPIPALSKGIYFCELLTSDGRRTTIKFVL